jgi:hypothetical protein
VQAETRIAPSETKPDCPFPARMRRKLKRKSRGGAITKKDALALKCRAGDEGQSRNGGHKHDAERETE